MLAGPLHTVRGAVNHAGRGRRVVRRDAPAIEVMAATGEDLETASDPLK
jgi:hypothetical protein